MTRILTVILILIFFCFSCDDDCNQEISGFFKKGNSFASGSTQDFNGHAVFRYRKMLDSQQNLMHDSSKLLVILNAIDDCFTRQIAVSNVNFSVGDTTFLRNATFDMDTLNIIPKASLFRSHGDAILGSYDLIESKENWVLVDEVNADTTAISGQFNLSFFDRDDDKGEQKPIIYSNGEFDAVISVF